MESNPLPMGLGMALAQRPEAMARFTALSETEQKAFMEGAHAARSKEEMQAYVEQLLN